jgi:glycosyltransferase involved in cell wall biosynthesis
MNAMAGAGDTEWIVSQIGARELYAVPRAFHRRGHLARLYTDAWCRYGRSLVGRLPGRLQGLAGRYHDELPGRRVVAFTARTLATELTRRRPRTREEQHGAFLETGRCFAKRVRQALEGMHLDPRRHRFFAFDTGALETLELTRARGIFGVVDQIDLARIDEEVAATEARKWPGWENLPGRAPETYFDRLAREWEMADLVVVNSAWSRRGLVELGVAEGKIATVPLAFEAETGPPPARPARPDRPLTVLWLGQVVLRKGFPYLVEAARRLARIRFVVAGPLGITDQAIATLPPNVTLLGRVFRAQARRLYQDSDVFVLPTMSDGFAITQLEAMSFGLPVIATPNCGEVVIDGQNGLIVPAGDSERLAEAIARLDQDRSLLEALGLAAAMRPREFTLDHYADRLERAVGDRLVRESAG